MAQTQVKGLNVGDYSIGRTDLNIATSGQAVITRIIEVANSGVKINASSGVDSGTGDVSLKIDTIYLGTLYAPMSHIGSGGVAHANVTTAVNGFMIAADKIKLDGLMQSATATLPVSTGWYRIAASAVGIARCSGRFEIDWAVSGYHGQVIINAGVMYGQDPTLNQIHYSHFGISPTKVRIVYHTTYSGNYAYLEIYNSVAVAVVVNVQMFSSLGWSLVTPSTAGSIPVGYSTQELAFVDGIATEGNMSAASFMIPGGTATQFMKANGTIDSNNYISSTYNSSLNSDSRNSRGVTRLYRNESDSDYSVQTYWTGSYWILRGYTGDTYHAGCQVAYADTAGNSDTLDGQHAGYFQPADTNLFRFETFTSDANTLPGNRSSFSYSVNAPYTGPLVHFGANNYGLQISSPYTGGNGISFRSRNGDAGTWNSWRSIWHDGNFNPASYATAGHAHDYATHRGEGTNYVDYARYVYNNGAYSGSGWTEPSDLGVRYANSAGNADTVDNQHFAYSNNDNNPTFLWGTNSNGSSFLAWRAGMSVSYATTAGSAPANGGTSTAANYANQLQAFTEDNFTGGSHFIKAIRVNGWSMRLKTCYDGGGATTNDISVAYADAAGYISGYNNPTTAANANTIVYRDGSGHITGNYILGSYINASAGNSENPTIGQIWTQNTGDNYLRKSTPDHFINQLGLARLSDVSSSVANGHNSVSASTNIVGISGYQLMAGMSCALTPKGNHFLVLFDAPFTFTAYSQPVTLMLKKDGVTVKTVYFKAYSESYVVSFHWFGDNYYPGYETVFQIYWNTGTSTYQNGASFSPRNLTVIDLP